MASSTADLLRGATTAMSSGKSIDSNNVESLVGSGSSGSSPGEHHSSASEESDEVVRAENSVNEDLLAAEGESEDTPSDSRNKGPASPAKAKDSQTSDKEVITVTDADGRRRKIEIDYSSKEATRKAHLMAAGARKWQAERDQAIRDGRATQEKLAVRDKDWAILEDAHRKGPEALFDLLQGERGAFQKHVAQQMKRAEFLANASPEQRKALELQEQAEQSRRDVERIRQENEDFRKQVTTERETAELRSLESRVNPVFDKYRFADKLGNPEDEHMFDEMLWNTALKRLEPLEEQGLEITQELAEREFRAVSGALRRRISAQAGVTAVKAATQRKQEATENVQAKIKSGYKASNSTTQEARDLINSGNITGLLKGWKKYGSLFNK